MVDHDTDVHDIDVEEVKSKFPRKVGHFDERKTEHRQVFFMLVLLSRTSFLDTF